MLNFKTRSMTDPKGKPRVYFCCHPEDFAAYFDTVCSDLLTMQNCAVWYADPTADRDGEFLQQLHEMQLFVMPVTHRLLNTSNHALEIEFCFAVENHIPVLPLMFDDGLVEIFNRKCGDIQYLDRYSSDETAISYSEKLEKYLASVLIGDELAEKVRAAFDAYVFLSYRKKDRKYAQELMRLIHKHDFCRDIAIWYDEYLTPGENFNDSIKAALEKSGLFVLTVTPNLVNEENYIMTTEYPMAKQHQKPILPAELVPTDRELLAEKYAEIPQCADARNDVELSEALLSAVQKMAIKENDQSPVHNFFIGLAYLNGIDVEVDRERAVKLITSAAEAGLIEAIDQLVQMLRTGKGVARSYEKAILWQKKKIERALAVYKETPDEENFAVVISGMAACGDYYVELAQIENAKQQFQAAGRLFEESNLEKTDKIKRLLFAVEQRLGAICTQQGDRAGTKHHYARCVDIASTLGDTLHDRRSMTVAFNNIGVYFKSEGELSEARKHYESALDIAYEIATETEEPFDLRMFRICLFNLGGICVDEGNPKKAEQELLRALQVADTIISLEDSVAAQRDKAQTLIVLGSAVKRQGRLSDASKYYLEALEIHKKIAADTETVTAQYDLCVAYNDVGTVFQLMGQYETAKQYYQASLKISECYSSETAPIGFRRTVATNLVNLGYIAKTQGQVDSAKEYYERAIEVRTALAEMTGAVSDRESLTFINNRLGMIYLEKGEFEKAEEYFNSTLKLSEQLLKQSAKVDIHQGEIAALINIGDIRCKQEKFDEAKENFQKALLIAEDFSKLNNTIGYRTQEATCYGRLGKVCVKQRNYEKAKEYYRKQLELRMLIHNESETVEALKNLAMAHAALAYVLAAVGGKSMAKFHFNSEAEAYEKLIQTVDTQANRRALATALKNAADIYLSEKDYEKSEELYSKQLKVSEAMLAEFKNEADADLTMSCYCSLARALYGLGRKDEARHCFKKYLEISLEWYEKTDSDKYLSNVGIAYYNLSAASPERQKELLQKAIYYVDVLCAKYPQSERYKQRQEKYKEQYLKKFGE